ncbi:hypothetical protein FOA43_003259 [Brettanomyces nanus]|uniref:Pheromone alpha factor receptor n=1 Tax=Eeniella nana TaxID=13502 RepID=A0A875S4N3_EENNA|nr:uncharacterized protein FOA43_003259 [Brettanomyces nanus]QPG75873.1 hypothetical protein FOA43_003259 [Brettanomyces nanus]
MNEASVSSIPLTYESAYGSSEITFKILDSYVNELLIFGIVFGVRIGMACICLPVTFLITKNKKSPIFVLNMACLVALFIHSIMYVCSLTDWYNTLAYEYSGYLLFSGYASQLTAATNTVYTVLIALVEISFGYQVFVLFRSPKKRIQYTGYLITLVSVLLGLATVVLYFIYMVVANKVAFDNTLSIPKWLVNTPSICFTASSCVTSLLLVCKLAVAIRTRKTLGLKQFGIFHILFIMSFQTMIVPTIIILVSYNKNGSQNAPHALTAIGTALVAISLPMTTMWANSILDSSVPTSAANTYLKTISDTSYRSYGSSSTPTSTGAFTYENEKEDFNNTALTSPQTLRNKDQGEDTKFWRQIEMYADELDPRDLENGVDEKQQAK